jgi:predicted dinucleotide-binding enzyme
MNVTIIGAGNMARGIGSRLVEGGHAIALVDREWKKASELATDLGNGRDGATVEVAGLERALASPIVVLALPFAAARDYAAANAAKLAGKIVIDISNPLNATYDGLVTAPGRSAAEEIANLLPKSRLVKAFNTTFAGTLLAGKVDGHPLDVFVAGDDDEAKQVVIGLIADGKLRGIDAGGLSRARELEALGLLGITLQGPLGLGFQSAWKLVA